MEIIPSYTSLSNTQLIFYYFGVLIALFYPIVRCGFSRYTFFMSFVFSMGFWGYMEYQYGLDDNVAKILAFLMLALLVGKQIIHTKFKDEKVILICMVLFTLSYTFTHLTNSDFSLAVISQYVFSYLFPILLYLGFSKLNIPRLTKYARFVYYLLLMQICLSLFKIIVIGGFMEAIVGSIQFSGGGTAVSLSILGLFYIWSIKSSKLKKEDYILLVSLLLVAIASAKRTPVILFPFFLVLLLSYVNTSKSIMSFLKYIPVVVVFIYFGVRLNYTLNPEGVIWGSFDLQFLFEYIMHYNFGTTDITEAALNTRGRGGALFLLFDPSNLGLNSLNDLMFGNGVTEAVREEKGRFLGGDLYGIQHSGLMGRVVMETYKIGFAGVITFLALFVAILSKIDNKKFRGVLIIFLAFDFFLYYGTSLFSPSNSIMLVFIVLMQSKKYNYNFPNN